MTCPHVDALPASVTPSTRKGCADCLAAGEHAWAHLRMCLTCGHVACCDSSPHRHATAHSHAEGHPVMRSFEPGEDWRWCYEDGRVV
ncbi:UBP-type zinc finger domain-containing protein [Actinosynnema sp. NPDC050436]|uniref:UBP-type zinc finger domain-containing protein n=1 Tax=Actinosynnema sp. NPDC050436 TaxID=3155659 RepID=UPI0033E4C9D5